MAENPSHLTAAPSPKISSAQWRSGIAAWLGWMFDGLELHIFTLVGGTYVALLIGSDDPSSHDVTFRTSLIGASFLFGWAIGGSLFGRLGDRLGRARTLALTILTYAVFTGLSAVAHSWWDLLIFRFISALGIGGEWAIGASLLSESWPKDKHAWLAAILQTAVNFGILIACGAQMLMAGLSPRYLFLVGILPALVVFWIRKKVPETNEWTTAREHAPKMPSAMELFRGPVLRVTLSALGVCALSLTAWWAFLFWDINHIKTVPELANHFDKTLQHAQWLERDTTIKRMATAAFFTVIGVSVAGNFFAAFLAKLLGYRKAVIAMFAGFFICFMICYSKDRSYASLLTWMSAIGFFSGVFGLFTMYLPPLFPTLLRTTGAGLCFNIGRAAAAAGVVIFGLVASVNDFRIALLIDDFLFLPAIAITLFMPDHRDNETGLPSPPALESLVKSTAV